MTKLHVDLDKHHHDFSAWLANERQAALDRARERLKEKRRRQILFSLLVAFVFILGMGSAALMANPPDFGAIARKVSTLRASVTAHRPDSRPF